MGNAQVASTLESKGDSVRDSNLEKCKDVTGMAVRGNWTIEGRESHGVLVGNIRSRRFSCA